MSVYENLPLGPNQIRLQTVSPPKSDDENDPIHCSLEVVNLIDKTPIPQYYALSYTWDAPAEYGKFKTMTSELNYPITCRGNML
jgi:hypothetical protein